MQVWNFCFTLGWGCRISRLHNFGPMRPWFALAINSSPTGTFIFVCFPELPWEMHTKIQLPWEQRGFPVCCWWLPCLDPSSPHTTGQRCSVVACPHVASAGQSVCCGWMNPVGGCLSSHDGNNTRAPLSRTCHGVSVAGSSCMNESLKSTACIKSRTRVRLW